MCLRLSKMCSPHEFSDTGSMCTPAKSIQLCLFVTSWTVAHQAPLSMGFSRQGYWSGLPFPSPGDLPVPETEPTCTTLQADH